MDWLLAAVNYHYVAVFKDSKKAANERAPTFEADAKELAAQLSILDGALAGKAWVAGKQLHHRRHRAGPDHAPVPGFPDRAAGAHATSRPGGRSWRNDRHSRKRRERRDAPL